MTFFGRIGRSFQASVGDIVFGMEDGTVSIFGLVFGVALSAQDSQAVLLAGATGAAAAAVSMMAGTYLDAESERDAAAALARRSGAQRAEEAAATAARIGGSLAAAGVPAAEVARLTQAVTTIPGAVDAMRAAVAPDDPAAKAGPAAHALWMFAADLFAGAVPVLPFAFLPLAEARIASLVVTTILLLALGIGRGLVAGRNVLRTTIETLAIAAAAAAAGVAIGRAIS
jgi:VIT1/CCC1 family predicted Fe2+/Mn2+ transporter